MGNGEFPGFGQNSGMGVKPALLVIDFIKGFTSPDCLLGSNLDREIEATLELLRLARDTNIPIIYTTVVYESHFKEGAHFIQKVPALKCLTQDSKWIDIDPRLERRESEPLIVKKFASAFYGTSLNSLLTYQNIDTTIIVGCSTSGCVRATVVDALQHGYRVVVPEECVGDRSKSAHNANLVDINTKYGDVVQLKSIKKQLFEIERS